jgi:hypothetical protein
MCAYVHTYICVYIYREKGHHTVDLHTCIYVHTRTHVRTEKGRERNMHMYHIACIHTFMHACIHTYTAGVGKRASSQTYMPTYTHTYTH